MSENQAEESTIIPKKEFLKNNDKHPVPKRLIAIKNLFFVGTLLLTFASIWILIVLFKENDELWKVLSRSFPIQADNFIFFRILIYSLVFLSTIVVLHLWTVFEGEARAMQIGLESVKHCKYCGTKEAGLICPRCDSVQWDPKHALSGTAIYIAHHRKHILTTLLAVGLIGPTTFAFSRFNENVTHQIQIHESYEKEAENVMNSILQLRAYLHEFELLQQYRWEQKNNDIERFRQICNEYYKVSWYSSRVIDYLGNTICDSTWRAEKNYETLRGTVSQAYSCQLLNKKNKIMKELDINFIDFVNAFKVDYLNASSEVLSNNTLIHNETLEKSKTLFENSKVLACIIAELTFNHSLDKNRSGRLKVYDCSESLKNGVNFTDRKFLEFPWGNTVIQEN